MIYLFFYFRCQSSPLRQERIRPVLSLFLAHYLPHQSGVDLDRVRTGVHCGREWTIICPGENRPIPSKLTVCIPAFTVIVDASQENAQDGYCFHSYRHLLCLSLCLLVRCSGASVSLVRVRVCTSGFARFCMKTVCRWVSCKFVFQVTVHNNQLFSSCSPTVAMTLKR